jgi:glycosyltransferase involved in cell wall biosynthesis
MPNDSLDGRTASTLAARPPLSQADSNPLRILIVVPALEMGAADASVVDLVRILIDAGHQPIVVSRGGRRTADIGSLGAEWIALNVASINPAVMLANVPRLIRIIRERKCDVVHAHGRAAAWSAYLAARATECPFVTTWHKGFRQQNVFKRLYNSVMVRGERVVVVSGQLADLVGERYGTPAGRISVIPASVDIERFDPAGVAPARIDAIRASWGVQPDTKVVLVTGRMRRRKGHHISIDAARLLKDLGMRDFLFVFAGEEGGSTRYADELWDRVLATGTADVIRLAGAVEDQPAAYAAASVVVSAAVEPEGMQRAILEAQAMARPVIVSDLGAGSDVVLTPPAVSEDRMTGLRFPAKDASALAAALVRLFSMPDAVRDAVGARGRTWVAGAFNTAAVAEQTLALYASVARPRAAQ